MIMTVKFSPGNTREWVKELGFSAVQYPTIFISSHLRLSSVAMCLNCRLFGKGSVCYVCGYAVTSFPGWSPATTAGFVPSLLQTASMESRSDNSHILILGKMAFLHVDLKTSNVFVLIVTWHWKVYFQFLITGSQEVIIRLTHSNSFIHLLFSL